MSRDEFLAPILVREIGERHYCNRQVIGARGRKTWVYCRQCNLAAISIAKKLDRALRTHSSRGAR